MLLNATKTIPVKLSQFTTRREMKMKKKNYNFKPQRIERKATPSIFKALCIWERDRAKDKVVRNK